MLDLTPILQSLLGVLATGITAFVLPYIKHKFSAEQQQQLSKWISIAVSAAEQITELDTNAAKKAYVIAFLESKGYSVDLNNINVEINAMIESAVYFLKNGG